MNVGFVGDNYTQVLDWSGHKFDYKNMVVLNTIGDGNCFFHAIIQGFYDPYNEGYSSDRKHPVDKSKFITNLRKELSELLSLPINSRTKKTWYEYLSRGELKNMAKEMPRYNLDNMKKLLASNSAVDNIFLEFISSILDLDIYILDGDNKRLYRMGYDDELLYLNRRSIVILNAKNHYSTVGIIKNDFINTLFDPQDPFIEYIKTKMIYDPKKKM